MENRVPNFQKTFNEKECYKLNSIIIILLYYNSMYFALSDDQLHCVLVRIMSYILIVSTTERFE